MSNSSRVQVALVLALGVGGGCADASSGEAEGDRRLPAEHRVTREYAAQLDVDLSAMEEGTAGLYLEDLETGAGARADSGDVVTVHYTVWLPQGTEVDSSRGGSPFRVALGYGRVIQGWDMGVVGMREGGRRRLVVPPALGYGEAGKGRVPGNSTLVFDVELLEVEDRTGS